MSEALKLLFRKDEEFKRWSVQHTNNRETFLKGESAQPEKK